jgi:predicted transcriptional regulator of viral defense system
MDYFKLSRALRRHKLYIFTLRDVENLFPEEKIRALKNNFVRWLAKGYFARLKRDLYEFIEQGGELRIPDLYVANQLYKPSYVSTETALSFYSIIPDVAAAVTSVTTKATRTFKNKYGSFYYKSCQKKSFTGYRLMLFEGFKIYIADKEKALVDFLYYLGRLGRPLDFEEERFNKRILGGMEWKKAFFYAGLFNKKTVDILKRCREYAKC